LEEAFVVKGGFCEEKRLSTGRGITFDASLYNGYRRAAEEEVGEI